MERWRTTLCIAAVLSLIAALSHVSTIAGHFEEGWGYGALVLLAAVFQGACSVALLYRPRLFTFGFGIVGNLVVLVLYATTRTVEEVGGST